MTGSTKVTHPTWSWGDGLWGPRFRAPSNGVSRSCERWKFGVRKHEQTESSGGLESVGKDNVSVSLFHGL